MANYIKFYPDTDYESATISTNVMTSGSTSNIVYLGDYRVPPAQPAKPEDEIAWLRRRVDEVLFQEFAA